MQELKAVADLFADDAVVQGEALEALAEPLARLVASPEWQMYRALVQRTRAGYALTALEGRTDATELIRMSGYLAGLHDAVQSAEKLAERAKVVALEEEAPTSRLLEFAHKRR